MKYFYKSIFVLIFLFFLKFSFSAAIHKSKINPSSFSIVLWSFSFDAGLILA